MAAEENSVEMTTLQGSDVPPTTEAEPRQSAPTDYNSWICHWPTVSEAPPTASDAPPTAPDALSTASAIPSTTSAALSTTSADVPPTTSADVSPTVLDAQPTVSDISHIVSVTPPTVSNAPPKVADAQLTVADAPHTVPADVPPTVSADVSPTLSADVLPTASAVPPIASTVLPTASEDVSPIASADVQPTASDVSPTVSDAPPTVSNFSPTVSDVLPTVSDTPLTMSDTPPTVADFSLTVADAPPTASANVPPIASSVLQTVSADVSLIASANVSLTVSDVSPTVLDVPLTMSDAPPIASADVPPTMSDAPLTVSDAPPTVADVPPFASVVLATASADVSRIASADVPLTALDVSPMVSDVPLTAADASLTVSADASPTMSADASPTVSADVPPTISVVSPTVSAAPPTVSAAPPTVLYVPPTVSDVPPIMSGKETVQEPPPSSSSSSSSKWLWVDELIYKGDDPDKKGFTYFSCMLNDKPVTKYPYMFTAPINMRIVDRDEFIFNPRLVSIGPFHYNKFPSMEQHKLRFLFCMLRRHDMRVRVPDDTDECKFAMEKLVELGNCMEIFEEDTRGYYSKAFPEMNQSQFLKMMVLDGCFLLEVFRLHFGLYPEDGDDPIFTTQWMLPVLALDFVKLENQLPYFVLDELYRRTRLSEEEPTLMSLVSSFFAFLCPEPAQSNVINFPKHLLALFHSTFIPEPDATTISIPEHRNGEMDQQRFSIPSAKDLLLCGIQIVKRKGSERGSNFLQIKYAKGKLKIPTLVIDNTTNTQMKNLIAYEQCDKNVQPVFTSYVTFMDALVKSAEDVEVLRIAGVIDHYMNNNEEVSKLLNNLTANIKYDMTQGYLKDLNEKIYRHYHSRLSQWKVRVRRLIYSREGILYIVSIAALYLTLLQTGFTMLDYLYPRSARAPK